jgi:G2/mitotic-specific cyclin 1/2
MPLLESEYSDPEILSDDDSAVFPLAAPFYSEYQELIVSHLERVERVFLAVPSVRPVKPSHRSKIIAWLLRVNDEMQFNDETVLLSACLFDRVAALRCINRVDLQLTASTCLWIASKIEEKLTPTVSDFAYLCGGTYSGSDFVECEAQILALLRFAVASTTPIVHVQAIVDPHGRIAELARFLCFALMFRPTFGALSPALMGATAAVLACLFCGERKRICKQQPSAIAEYAREVLLALDEIVENEENPMHELLPKWMAVKDIAEVRDEMAELVRRGAIRTCCFD